MEKKMKLASPDLNYKEMLSVLKVIGSGVLSMGKKVIEFEEMFAKYIGVKHAVAVSSGTAGLHLAVIASGIEEGDEVITTPLSFIASANCILYERAKPVFVDINPETYNIDPSKIADKITNRTKAIIPVHLFGRPCYMRKIVSLARLHGMKIIEDSCEAIGAKYENAKVGSLGDFGVFAFYPNKMITTGEGGMITTNDYHASELLKSLRNQGRDVLSQWLDHDILGYNYRMGEINAAIGIEQLKKIDTFIRKRERVANWYKEELGGISNIKMMNQEPKTKMSWFVFIVEVKNGIDRDGVISRLRDAGVQTRPYFSAIHLQAFYKDMGYRYGDYPVCEYISNHTLALPFHNNMKRSEVCIVCNELKKAIKHG